MGYRFSWYAANKQVHIKELGIYYVPMIFLVKMHGLFFLKDKNRINIFNASQTILDSSKRTPNNIWVDKESEFCNTSFKKWLKGNDIKKYSTYSEGKCVVVERFIRTFKNKIFKHMTTVSKNVYFDFSDDIADKYNHTCHGTIKIKLVDVKSNSYAEYSVDLIKKIQNLK